MSQLSNEEIYEEIGKIVASFDLYKCDECATAVMQWLRENNISGKIIKIETRQGEDYIINLSSA
ncbi:papain fold toxin domain-containing protein [Scytonema sp. NUACC26]|uniref:papain fold toxin domain-containing protein n=1 Tax=Scytonema sp. NUACC26 TaxID=3140176 RepID=UPI0034DC67AA